MNVLTQQKKHTVETLLGRGAHGRGGFDGDHVVAVTGKPCGIPTRTGPDIEDATCSIRQQVDQTAMNILEAQALVLVGEIVGVVVVEHSGWSVFPMRVSPAQSAEPPASASRNARKRARCYPGATPPRSGKSLHRCKPLFYLVAGEGFEPSTFGL